MCWFSISLLLPVGMKGFVGVFVVVSNRKGERASVHPIMFRALKDAFR